MRILVVWFTALVLITFITFTWYISQPIVIGVARALQDQVAGTGSAENVFKFTELASYFWGPIFDIMILAWAIMYSTKRDVESEIYG